MPPVKAEEAFCSVQYSKPSVASCAPFQHYTQPVSHVNTIFTSFAQESVFKFVFDLTTNYNASFVV